MLLKWLNRNIDYTKKWWAEGNRKVRIITSTKEEFNYWKVMVTDYEDDIERDIKTAERYYIGNLDILKYVRVVGDEVEIGYYENGGRRYND